MTDDLILNTLLWIGLSLSLILIFFSCAAVGRHIGDLEYQKLKNLNGIRQQQTYINIRVHGNRLLFGLYVGVTALLALAEAPDIIRMWFGRLGFIVLLVSYAYSSVHDWIANYYLIKQAEKDPMIGQGAALRESIHVLNTSLSALYIASSLATDDPRKVEEIDKIMVQVRDRLKVVQESIREADPTYGSHTFGTS